MTDRIFLMRRTFPMMILSASGQEPGYGLRLCLQPDPFPYAAPDLACSQAFKEAYVSQTSKDASIPCPDGKTQVGVEYKDGRPFRIHSITVIASQNIVASSGGPGLNKQGGGYKGSTHQLRVSG